jgi:hypothetical protein
MKMNKLNFSKGKWEANDNVVYSKSKYGIAPICTVDRSIVYEENKANAQLISKTPEMFLLLVEVYDKLDIMMEVGLKNRVAKILDEATKE